MAIIIGIIIGVCGLAYAWYTKTHCAQINRDIQEENATNLLLKEQISQELKDLSKKRSF